MVSAVIYLPVSLSLFWTFLFARVSYRTESFWPFITLMVAVMMAEYSIACYYDPSSSWHSLLVASNLSQFFTPCVIPLLMIYLRKLRTHGVVRTRQLVWVLVPVILFTVAEQSSSLSGREEIELFVRRLYTVGTPVAKAYPSGPIHSFFVSSVYYFRVVIVLEVLILLGSFIYLYKQEGYNLRHIWDFLFRGKNIDIVELQYANLVPVFTLSMVMLFMYRDFLSDHLWIPITLSILLALFTAPFSFIAFYGAKRMINLHDLNYGLGYNYRIENRAEILSKLVETLVNEDREEMRKRIPGLALADSALEAEKYAAEEQTLWPAKTLYSEMYKGQEESSLVGRFDRLMIKEQLYLQPGLTLTEVADMLNTNKTYVSKMVNTAFKMPFPDLVNILRIDFAEEYLVSHRDATQTEIARVSGFPSASSLNNTFKKVTGMTPRIWLATYDNHHTAHSID